jgi:RimJ/RimL family protein N-acetyltransferase
VGPWRPDGWPGTEVGWGLTSAATGHGFALEAAAAAIDWAFEILEWEQVIHCIEPENVASIRLAERLGATYRYETEMPPPLDGHVTHVYAQDRAAWRRLGSS